MDRQARRNSVYHLIVSHYDACGEGLSANTLERQTGFSETQLRSIIEAHYSAGRIAWDARLRLIPATKPPDFDRCGVLDCPHPRKETKGRLYRFCDYHLRQKQQDDMLAVVAARNAESEIPAAITLTFVDYHSERVWTLTASVADVVPFPETTLELQQALDAARKSGAFVVATE